MLRSGFETMNKTQAWPSKILQSGAGARQQQKCLCNLIICEFTRGNDGWTECCSMRKCP